MNDDILDVMEWVRYAKDDYDCAVAVAKTNDTYSPRIACSGCQESAEKILKAYTIAKEGTRIKTQNLVILSDRCKRHAPDFDALDAACNVLNMYKPETCYYPSGTKLTEADMNNALNCARKILEFTESKLKDLGYEYTRET